MNRNISCQYVCFGNILYWLIISCQKFVLVIHFNNPTLISWIYICCQKFVLVIYCTNPSRISWIGICPLKNSFWLYIIVFNHESSICSSCGNVVGSRVGESWQNWDTWPNSLIFQPITRNVDVFCFPNLTQFNVFLRDGNIDACEYRVRN